MKVLTIRPPYPVITYSHVMLYVLPPKRFHPFDPPLETGSSLRVNTPTGNYKKPTWNQKIICLCAPQGITDNEITISLSVFLSLTVCEISLSVGLIREIPSHQTWLLFPCEFELFPYMFLKPTRKSWFSYRFGYFLCILSKTSKNLNFPVCTQKNSEENCAHTGKKWFPVVILPHRARCHGILDWELQDF